MSASVQGFDVTAVLLQKAPNKMLQRISVGGMEQVMLFDGKNGVNKSPMGEEVLEGENLEQMAFEADMLAITKLDELGIKATLTGVEKIDDKDAYKIEFVLPSGGKFHHYYEKESGLKLREQRTLSTPQGTFTQTTNFSDYREVNGMKYPYKLVQSVVGMNIEMTVSNIEINTGLGDDLFK